MGTFEQLLYYSSAFDSGHPAPKKEIVICMTQECVIHRQLSLYGAFALFIVAAILLWCFINWEGIQEWRSHMFSENSEGAE